MYKILISGYYGFNNIGDESILRTVIDNFRSELRDVDLTVLSRDPADTEAKYGVHAVARMDKRAIVTAIKDCDMLVFGGGSLMQDATSSGSLWYYLFIIAMARFYKKKIMLYSQGIGPINGKFNRRLTARVLRGVDEIAVRDVVSAQLLDEIGVPSQKVSITADPVLGSRRADPEKGRAILARAGLKREDGRSVVGWAVKAGGDTGRFLLETEKAIRNLKQNRNVDIVLIPFHYEQDVDVVVELSQRLGGEVYALTEKYLSDEMLAIIGSLDCLIGIRLHSLIFAAIMGVPMIGIAYDLKVEAFMSSIGLRCMARVEDFRGEDLLAVFDQTMMERETVVAATTEATEKLKDRLLDYDKKIREVIESENTKDATAVALSSADTVEKTDKKRGGVLAAIGGVMLVTIAAKLLGIIRESIQANVFGVVDSFYASYNKTIYLFTTIAYAMCVAAVPIITKALVKGRKEGTAVANNIITFGILLSLIFLGLWELMTIDPIAAFLWPLSDGDMVPFMRLMALTLPVIVVTYLLVAVFQSMDHFALQGSMSLPYSVFLIGFLLFFAAQEAIMAYVVAVCIAWLLQFAMALPYCVKERYLYRPRLDLRADYLPFFLKTAIVTVVTTSAYLFCYLIDASVAESLGTGAITAFYYADKIFTPLTTTFIYSISIVLFPKLNRHYLKSDHREYLEYVWNIISRALIAVFPVSAVLIVFGDSIIKVLFESGNFTVESTVATSAIFMMYALGMAGFSVIDLLNKAFFSMNKLLAPFLISLLVIAVNAIADSVFSASGALLALSTAIAISIGAVITVAVIFRGEDAKGIVAFGPIFKSLFLTLIVAALAWFLKDLFVFATDGKLLLVAKCLAIGAVAMIAFVGGCFPLRIEAITSLLRKNNR